MENRIQYTDERKLQYIVTNEFRPQNEEKYLRLNKGDLVTFIREEETGEGMRFIYGENERTHKRGLFPPPCVYKGPKQQNTSVEEDEKLARALVEEDLREERMRFEKQNQILEKDMQFARKLQEMENKRQTEGSSVASKIHDWFFDQKTEPQQHILEEKPGGVLLTHQKLQQLPQPLPPPQQQQQAFLEQLTQPEQQQVPQKKQEQSKEENNVIVIKEPPKVNKTNLHEHIPFTEPFNVPETPDRSPQPHHVCSQCSLLLLSSEFSNRQLSLQEHKKCKNCIAKNKQTPQQQVLEKKLPEVAPPNQKKPQKLVVHPPINPNIIPQPYNMGSSYIYPNYPMIKPYMGNQFNSGMYYPQNPLTYSGRPSQQGPVNVLGSTLYSTAPTNQMRLKVFYGDEIKRFGITDPEKMTFEQLLKLINHPTLTLETASIYYKDLENDDIVLDKISWKEALKDWEWQRTRTISIIWKKK